MKIYNTVLGDTFDIVSYKMYGSANYTNELFNANPQLQDKYIFPANIAMQVPDVDVAIVSDLAPWERPDTTNNEDTELSEIYQKYFVDTAPVFEYTSPTIETINDVIKKVFADSSTGIYLDLNSAQADGSKVGFVADGSGKNNDLTQDDLEFAPYLKRDSRLGCNYLSFDGFNDFLSNTTINFNQAYTTMIVCLSRGSVAGLTPIIEYGSDNKSFVLGGVNGGYIFAIQNDAEVINQSKITDTYKNDTVSVLTCSADFANIVATMKDAKTKKNGTASTFDNNSFRLDFDGGIYSLLIVNKQLDNEVISKIEQSFAKFAGIEL